MRKKLVSCILVVCMLLSMLPTMAWAEEAKVLNIADGSITITDAGWTQGTATGTDLEVTITGTSTENTITVESGDPTITLSGVDMSANISKPLIDLKVDTKILLAGTNTITQGTANLPAINVRNGVTLTIDVDGIGSVTATAGNNAAGIGGGSAGSSTAKGFNGNSNTWGSIVIDGGIVTSVGSGVAGGLGGGTGGYATAVTINGGVVNASASGNRGATGIRANAVTITGGEVTADGKAAGIAKSNEDGTDFTMSGGTLVSVTATASAGTPVPINAASATITGGNVNGYYDTNATLYFTDAETGAALANTEVTINGWTAKTNSSGVIYTNLETVTDGTEVTATVGGNSMTATLKAGVGLFGATCVCDTTHGTIVWEGSVDDVTLYEGVDSRVFDISAKYVADSSCKAPTHGDYETVTITENSDYASYAEGKLTVNTHTANYEVTLSADANGINATKTIKVTIESKKGFDIMEGTITFDGTKYTQGIEEYTPEANEQVVVFGSGTTDNYLEVTSGTANVILDNVNLDDKTNGDPDDANGMIRVKGGTLNLTLQGENTFTRYRGGLIFVGSLNSANAGDAVLNVDCAESSDCANEACPHTLTLVTGNSRSAIIGAARGNDGAAVEINTDMSGTITINGGSIIIPNAFSCGIGTPDAGGEYYYDIDITGGSVTIGDVSAQGAGIGLGRNSKGLVNVNITGGVVDVAIVGEDNNKREATGIGAGSYATGTVNITIGAENAASDAEPVVKAYTVPVAPTPASSYSNAIGKSGNSCADVSIKILSGTVEATGYVAIGFSLNGSFGTSGANNVNEIIITGGDVTANGYSIGIGASGPAGYPYDNKNNSAAREMDVTIEISGDAKVNATGSLMAIGMINMGTNSTAEVEVGGTAEVTATATGVNPVTGNVQARPIAVGTTVGWTAVEFNELPAAGSTRITITSPNVTLQSTRQPIAAATETALEEGTTYTIKTEDGTLTVEIPEGASATVTDSTVALPKGTELTDESGNTATVAADVTVAADKLDEVTADADGNVTLPAGSTVTKGDETITLPEGGTIAPDGTVTSNGDVTVTDKDENVTTITPPAGEDVTVNPDGTVEVPAGSEIKTEGGTVTIPEDAGTVTIPVDKVDEVAEDEDGNVTLPAGSTVTKGDETITLPEGGTIAPDGTVTSNGDVTVTDKDENVTTITPPAGEDVTVNPDGTVEVPAGSEIKTEDGTVTIPEDAGTVTIPADKVDEVAEDEDGNVTLPAGSTVTKDDETIELPEGGTIAPDGTVTDSTKPTPKPPYSGGYYPIYTPSVTPAAPSVDSSSLNDAALAVGSAIKDGSAEFVPVNGYTKEEVLQLQKDGKLRLGIEKKSGYASLTDKELIEAAIKSAGGAVDGVAVMYFDITPVLMLDNGTVVAHVTDTEKAITITIELSADMTKAAKDGKQIAVVRVHDGKAEILSSKLNSAKTKVTFSSSDFSTYAVVALNKTTSTKTFDAGIGLYVGMSVLAAIGGAVVIGKKRK